jgi:putative DNA primase/helicase
MKRKAPGETVKKLRDPMADDGLDMLRRSLCRWAEDHGGKVDVSHVQMVDGLNDRAADNWRPLLAIADMAGGDWPVKARTAALALSGDDTSDTDSTRTTLLADIAPSSATSTTA